MIRSLPVLVLLITVLQGFAMPGDSNASDKIFADTIHIGVDVKTRVGDMRPFWAFFGYDEPNYTTRPNGQKLLKELQQLSPVPVYVRTHNLLTSRGNSTGPDLKWGFTDAYHEDASGKPIYNWTVVDSIVDTYVGLDMRPLMEIGFMPKDLSTHPEPYEHHWSAGGNIWTGWTYPPKDYQKWNELVYQWVKHSIERYGKDTVKTWLWEVWNEPDIGYWSGTFDEYCKLYDFAADGLKRACPECTIGGPHTTSPRGEKGFSFFNRFIDHCLDGTNYATGKKGTPLQYVGFHAKGAPDTIGGHVRMNMGVQLKDIDRAFAAVAANPKLKNIPIIIGECDPEGCAACSETREPKYAYRNGTMYSSYTAASFARIYELMSKHNVNLLGAVSWSFEFENQPWFAGFRDLATNGVDKPVLNVFRMLGMMKGDRVAVNAPGSLTAQDIIANGMKGKADVNVLASADAHSLSVLVWNYHDDDLPGDAEQVSLSVDGLPAKVAKLQDYEVSTDHSNAFEAWKKMGRPQQVDAASFAALEKAGKLQLVYETSLPKPSGPSGNSMSVSKPYAIKDATIGKDGHAAFKLTIPRQAVVLIRLSW